MAMMVTIPYSSRVHAWRCSSFADLTALSPNPVKVEPSGLVAVYQGTPGGLLCFCGAWIISSKPPNEQRPVHPGQGLRGGYAAGACGPRAALRDTGATGEFGVRR